MEGVVIEPKGMVRVFVLLSFVGLVACGNPTDGSNKSVPSVPIPAAPKGLAASSGNGDISLQWLPVPSASSYTLYIGRSPGFTLKGAQRLTGLSRPSHLHRPLGLGAIWYYRVAAFNSSGEGPAGGELAAMAKGPPPAMPTGATVTGSTSDITLRWNPVAGATSYAVFWSSTPGSPFAKRGEKIVTTRPEFRFANPPHRRTIYFAVAAVNDWGMSSLSPEVGTMVQATLPPPPAGLAASGGDGGITVRWDAVPGATSYNVYMAESSGRVRKTGKVIAGITEISCRQDKMTSKSMRYYVVTAVNSAGEGRSSNESGAMP